MTFSGTWIIPAVKGNNLQRHFVGLEGRLDMVLFSSVLVYLGHKLPNLLMFKICMLKNVRF